MDIPPVAAFAIAAHANEFGVPKEQIAVVRVERKDWPDSSLGCPEPGRAYLSVITSGYRIILAAAGKEYEYHTNDMTMAVRCPR